MIQEVKVFTEERPEFLSLDIKRYLNANSDYDYEITFSTTPIQSEGSNTGTLYSALVILKDRSIRNIPISGTAINQGIATIENKGPKYNQGDVIC